MKNLTAGIHGLFLGVNFESDLRMDKKGRFRSATK